MPDELAQLDRRQRNRRSEDADAREMLLALNAAVFGVRDHPETGLMARHMGMEDKIDNLTREAQHAKWAAACATVAFLAGIVAAFVTKAVAVTLAPPW